MKRFGLGKKGDDGDDSRSALFGRKKSSPAPPSDNPYARQAPQANDPYADEAKYANMTPYQKAKAGIDRPGGPPGGSAGGDQEGYGAPPPGPPAGGPGSRPTQSHGQPPSPAPKNGAYGAPPSQGFSSDRYGSGGGYGANRYDNSAQNRYNSPAAGARGPGGYGGLGRTDTEPDDNRDVLFSGAQERYTQQQQQGPPPPTYSQAGGDQGGFEGYGEQRELTEEEQEEAEYQSILQEKRRIQQESGSSVNRSVQMARQANEVGQATLARLGAQGERLHNTEKHLNLASNQNKIAQDRAAELKTLNRSMFAVHVGNPFTSKQRQQKADDEVMNRHRSEREQRETTRRDGYSANQRMESNFRDVNRADVQKQKTGKKDYGKYNLDDEGDEARQLEDDIDNGIDELSGQVHMMNMVGRAIGKEVDTQNAQIGRIMDKVSIPSSPGTATLLRYVVVRCCRRSNEDEQGASGSHQVRHGSAGIG